MTDPNALSPILLAPDQFTPLRRTPWGGDVIGRRYKSRLIPSCAGQRIGESWEFSCDPAFLSRDLESGMTLTEMIRQAPQDFLSTAGAQREGEGCQILVKLLDAAAPLSLQVHPPDDDPELTREECGKPESWLILDAQPGAGLYLGFSRPVSREILREKLLGQEDLRDLLQFVPVKQGDYFEIAPGTPHAIGEGVTLLEPQRILPGKSGKTYRFWDWNRRYDSEGQLDLKYGKPRELHVEPGLRLVSPESQVGEAFVDLQRRSPKVVKLNGSLTYLEYPKNTHYQVFRVQLEKGSSGQCEISNGYGAVTVLQGALSLTGQSQRTKQVVGGQPLFLPARSMPLRMEADESSDLAVVIPATAEWRCTVEDDI